MAQHFEKQLSSTEIFAGHVFRVTQDEVELENGDHRKREVVHHNGGACILALDDKGGIFLVRQYRYAIGREMWELPAGKLEPGEDPLEAAKRELSEEVGVTAANWQSLGTFYPTVGYCSEAIHLYMATGLTPCGMHLDEGEFLDPYVVPLEEMLQRIMRGEIQDSKTIIGCLKGSILLAQAKGEDGKA